MDWKEFFKPNKWKILMTVILFIVGFILMGFSIGCIGASFCGPTYLYIVFLIFDWPLILVKIFPAKLPIIGVIFASLIMIIVPLAYYYILSCVVIKIIKKFKK